MVHGHVAAFLLRVLQERELCHPEELKVVLLQQIQLSCDLQTESAQHVKHHFILVSGKEKQISRLAVHGGHQSL